MRLKGRRSRHLRPTADMVKEGLFSMLGQTIPGSSFLDLYAGTGAVGIEALSRDAGDVAFVEKRAELARTIRENLEATHLQEEASVICADATRAVKSLAAQGREYDFVFADPPYYTEGDEVLDYLHAILGQQGTLIFQHSKREAAPSPAGLKQIDQRSFGDTVLTFYHQDPDHHSRSQLGLAAHGLSSREDDGPSGLSLPAISAEEGENDA